MSINTNSNDWLSADIHRSKRKNTRIPLKELNFPHAAPAKNNVLHQTRVSSFFKKTSRKRKKLKSSEDKHVPKDTGKNVQSLNANIIKAYENPQNSNGDVILVTSHNREPAHAESHPVKESCWSYNEEALFGVCGDSLNETLGVVDHLCLTDSSYSSFLRKDRKRVYQEESSTGLSTYLCEDDGLSDVELSPCVLSKNRHSRDKQFSIRTSKPACAKTLTLDPNPLRLKLDSNPPRLKRRNLHESYFQNVQCSALLCNVRKESLKSKLSLRKQRTKHFTPNQNKHCENKSEDKNSLESGNFKANRNLLVSENAHRNLHSESRNLTETDNPSENADRNLHSENRNLTETTDNPSEGFTEGSCDEPPSPIIFSESSEEGSEEEEECSVNPQGEKKDTYNKCENTCFSFSLFNKDASDSSNFDDPTKVSLQAGLVACGESNTIVGTDADYSCLSPPSPIQFTESENV